MEEPTKVPSRISTSLLQRWFKTNSTVKWLHFTDFILPPLNRHYQPTECTKHNLEWWHKILAAKYTPWHWYRGQRGRTFWVLWSQEHSTKRRGKENMMMRWARYSSKAVGDSEEEEWQNMAMLHSKMLLIMPAIPAVNISVLCTVLRTCK